MCVVAQGRSPIRGGSWMRSSACLLLVAGLCGLVAAASAFAGGGDSRSSLVSPRQAFVYEAQVAAAPGSGAVVVWNQSVGEGGSTLMVSKRTTSTTSWSRPRRLYVMPGDTVTTFDPLVAMAPSGAAVVVWQGYPVSGPAVIEAVSRSSAENSWTRPVVIARGVLAGSNSLGMSDRGDAMLVYVGGSGQRAPIDVIRVRSGVGTWTGPTSLGIAVTDQDPTLAVNASGQAVAAWSTARGRPSGSYGNGGVRFDSWVEAAIWRDGRWSAAQRLGKETQYAFDADPDSTPDGPEVAIDRHGSAMAVWQHSEHDQQLEIEAATLRRPRSRWRALGTSVARSANAPQLVSSASGWATIAWETTAGEIGTRSGPINGCCWSRMTNLTPHSSTGDSDLFLVAGSGRAAGVAFEQNGVKVTTRARTGKAWTRPTSIGATHARAACVAVPRSLAAISSGQLLVLWTQEFQSSTRGLLDALLSATTITAG